MDHDYHTAGLGPNVPMDKSLEAEQMNLEQLIRVAQAEPLSTSAPHLVNGAADEPSYQIDGHFLPDNVDISRTAVHTG